MPYPHTDPRRYEGLLEHAERFLGAVSHGEPADVLGYNRGFAIGFHRHPSMAMVCAATTGVRFQDVEAELPQELVCPALPGQEDEAAYLVHVVAERVVRSGKGYEYRGGYVNAEPLIPNSEVVGLVAARHPLVDGGFDTFRDRAGAPALNFITLLPATPAELALVRTRPDGAADLAARWRADSNRMLDVYRQD